VAAQSARIGRVLVADDEPHVRRILVTLLEARALDVETASDGLAALELLERDREYDLVVLAKGQDTDREKAFSLGADEFVTKPFSPKKLLALIDTLLGAA
jgi:CheY-like chemotaxis protein